MTCLMHMCLTGLQLPSDPTQQEPAAINGARTFHLAIPLDLLEHYKYVWPKASDLAAKKVVLNKGNNKIYSVQCTWQLKLEL